MSVEPVRARRRPRNAVATRAALLRAATEAFTERGFDGTTLEQIAKAADVNKAMVSYHFGGKGELYHTILEGDIDRLSAEVEAIRSSKENAPDRLRRFVAVFGDLHRRSPHLSVLLLREMLAGGRALDPIVVPRFALVFQTIAEIAVQGAKQGAFRRVDPFLFHQSLVGSLVFFFAVSRFRERVIAEGKIPVGRAPSPEEYIRHVQTLVIRGLIRTADAASEEP